MYICNTATRVVYFQFDPKIWPNIKLGKKKELKGDEKRGGNAYFFPN